MKTWKTIALSVITTSTLVTGGALTYSYLQPSHYQGDTFKNEQSTSISNVSTNNSIYDNSSTTESNNSNTTPSSNYTESNSSETLEQRGGTCMGQTSGYRAYQPTFKIECISPKNDLYCVEHIPTGDKCEAITYEDAESFCTYMEQIANGKTSLSYTMDENYNTWKN